MSEQKQPNLLARMVRRILCKHPNTLLVRKVYGDEINHLGCREIHECSHCKAIIYKVRV